MRTPWNRNRPITPVSSDARMLRTVAIAVTASSVLLLVAWLTGSATPLRQEFSPLQQTSPLDPFATETPDPLMVPTDTPDPFMEPTETPDPFATPTGAFDDTMVPAATETPGTSVFVPQVQQPGVQETVEPTPEPFNYVASVVTGMAGVAAWIWLLCGSLVFFAVAGLVAGLYVSRQERHRYELYVLEPDESPYLEVQRPQPKDDSDDIWPASLP